MVFVEVRLSCEMKVGPTLGVVYHILHTPKLKKRTTNFSIVLLGVLGDLDACGLPPCIGVHEEAMNRRKTISLENCYSSWIVFMGSCRTRPGKTNRDPNG